MRKTIDVEVLEEKLLQLEQLYMKRAEVSDPGTKQTLGGAIGAVHTMALIVNKLKNGENANV